MKLLFKLFLVNLCMLIFTNASAQADQRGTGGNVKAGHTSVSTDFIDSDTQNSGAFAAKSAKDLGIPASVYLNDWSEGQVILKDNTVYDDWLLRYNVHKQQMQFIHGSDTSAFAEPDEISSLTFDGHTFVYDIFICENNQRQKGYLELLVDGNCQLYLYRCISHRYVDECIEPGAADAKEEYYMTKRYFLAEGEEPAKIIPAKKKDLIAMLEDDSKDVKSYIKEHKIKLCDEENLKELFSYYNEE